MTISGKGITATDQITNPGTITLTDGHILVGNASNQATDVAMSGDATMINTGALTIANAAVTNAKMANMAQATIKGRADAAGTGAPQDLTPAQVATILLGTNETIVAKTNGVGAPYAIVAADSQKIFTNEGASAEVYLTLPASPALGQKFTGICVDTDNMRFVASGSQTIRLGSTVSGAAGFAQLSGIGSTITLIYVLSDQWIAVSSTGTVNIT